MGMIFWDVFRNGVCIDSVPYVKTCKQSDVLHGLINHDNYPADIKVEPCVEHAKEAKKLGLLDG